jgi:putative transposase
MCFSWLLPVRRSIRLPAYDYASEGIYFVTFCTKGRRNLLGTVKDGAVHLNSRGNALEQEWLRTADIRRNVALDLHVVMPNHFHGILAITHSTAHGVAARRTLQSRSLGAIVGQIKAAAARRINSIRGTPGWPVWQRNYYEGVVRGDAELQALRDYIALNPLRWEIDRFHTE